MKLYLSTILDLYWNNATEFGICVIDIGYLVPLAGKTDLTFLIDIVQRKTSQLRVFSHKEWRRVFWAPVKGRQQGKGNPDNIIILGIIDFMYMRHLICKVQVFVIFIWFESLDRHLLRTRAI